jgi:hypothetical protein
MEQWARVPKPFSDQYAVSTEGRVYSLKTNRLMKLHSPNPKQPGYKQVRFSLGRRKLTTGTRGRRVATEYKSACWLVHRLVCAVFYPDLYTDDCEVHHRNFDPSDNRLDNLRIISPKDHKVLHKRIKRAVRNAKMRAIERHRVCHPVSPHPLKPIGDPTGHQTKFIF